MFYHTNTPSMLYDHILIHVFVGYIYQIVKRVIWKAKRNNDAHKANTVPKDNLKADEDFFLKVLTS